MQQFEGRTEDAGAGSKAEDESTATSQSPWAKSQHRSRMLWIVPLSIAKLLGNSTTAFDRWPEMKTP
jgi:hypothetical protein